MNNVSIYNYQTQHHDIGLKTYYLVKLDKITDHCIILNPLRKLMVVFKV